MELTGSYLETPRLILRIVTPDAHAHAIKSLSDAELMAFFGADEKALEREKARFEEGLTMFKRSFLSFYLIEKSSGKVIGWCGYNTWYTEHNRAEAGYHLNAEEHKQKGYMSEALEAVLAYGFTQMNLHRVEALVADYNMPSKNLLQKFGFTYEGTLREHYYVDGVPEDSLIYSLLKDEFNHKVK